MQRKRLTHIPLKGEQKDERNTIGTTNPTKTYVVVSTIPTVCTTIFLTSFA